MPICDQPVFVLPIVLHTKDAADSDLPATFWGLCSLIQVLEGLVLIELSHLKGG